MTPFEAKGRPLSSPRLDERGAVTRAWLIGSDAPEEAQLVEVYRGTLEPVPGRRQLPRPFYFYRVDGGPRVEHGPGLDELRRRLRRLFPGARVVEEWRR